MTRNHAYWKQWKAASLESQVREIQRENITNEVPISPAIEPPPILIIPPAEEPSAKDKKPKIKKTKKKKKESE